MVIVTRKTQSSLAAGNKVKSYFSVYFKVASTVYSTLKQPLYQGKISNTTFLERNYHSN